MKYQPSLQDEIIICRSHALYEFDQQVVVKLYNPLFNNPSTANLYSALNTIFSFGSNETPIMSHQELLRKLNCNSLERFEEMREELEAVGLIKTYFKKGEESNQYIIALRRIISPEKFFFDPCLSELLRKRVSKDTFEELQMQFLVHNFDLSKYENISAPFDECYQISTSEEESNPWWINFDGQVPDVKNQHFDLDVVQILIADQKGITEKVIRSKTFIQNINRMAFMFALDERQMVDAILDATEEGIINYDMVRKNCVRIRSMSEQRLVIDKQTVKSMSNNIEVNALESVSPAQLVKSRFGTELLPSEIEMFDELLAKNRVSVGVINVLILYVINNTNGQIPNITYFRKVLNTWIRAGVKTTEDALHQIDGKNSKAEKKQPEKPDWYTNYIKQVEEDQQKGRDTVEAEESLEELEKIFD